MVQEPARRIVAHVPGAARRHQERCQGKQQGTQIYETCGAYLGYGLAQYGEFYKIDHVMVLGRVSKGAGGDRMLDTTKTVLQEDFPELAGIKFHTADDHFKSVEQCIAASAASPIDGSGHCHPLCHWPSCSAASC